MAVTWLARRLSRLANALSPLRYRHRRFGDGGINGKQSLSREQDQNGN